MDVKVFDNDYLHKHSLWGKCPSTLNEVSERDYRGKNCFDTRIDCLDMDTYERQVCGGQADCTTDAVIGICDCENKKKRNPRLLLVELRMRYKSSDSLSETELKNKVGHTKSLLGAELTIDHESWFVFTNTVAPQARRWLSDRANADGGLKSFQACSVDEFNNRILLYDNLPYVPQTPVDEIKRRIIEYAVADDWNGLDRYIDHWLKMAEKYRYSNPAEYQCVKEAVLAGWENVHQQEKKIPDTECQLIAEILDENIQLVLR